MSKKKKNQTKKKAVSKNNITPAKKGNNTLMIAAAAVLLCAVIVLFVSIQIKNGASPSGKTALTISPGENLVISTADITSTAQFYSVEVDGTLMEILAVRDSSGDVRTAFNTCQICYRSGKGYYVQSGNELVCQNCGNRFTADQVEVESGGCNPWPIFNTDKTVTDETISISYDFLNESRQIFSQWKSNY